MKLMFSSFLTGNFLAVHVIAIELKKKISLVYMFNVLHSLQYPVIDRKI